MVIMMPGRAGAKRLRTVVGGLVVLSLLAACGSSTEDTADSPQSTGSPSAEGPSGSESPSHDQPMEFTGIISLDEGDGPDSWLEIHDPEAFGDGAAPITSLALPHGDTEWNRPSFSSDWRYAVRGEDSVEILELDDETGEYVEWLTLSPDEGSYSEAGSRYGYPRFAPDGHTLWFERSADDDHQLVSLEISPDADAGDITDSALSFQLSYRDPSAENPPWTFDSRGAPILIPEDDRVEIESQHAGEPSGGDWSARYWLDDEGAVVLPSLTTWNDDGDSSSYIPVKRGGPTKFIMATQDVVAGGSGSADVTGVVLRMKVDPAAETLNVEPLVPLAADGVAPRWSLVSPDSESVIFCHGHGDPLDEPYHGYRAMLDGQADEPEGIGRCDPDAKILDWN